MMGRIERNKGKVIRSKFEKARLGNIPVRKRQFNYLNANHYLQAIQHMHIKVMTLV